MGEVFWGITMLNRLTASGLLKSVILITALVVIVGFSLSAWQSWARLAATSRIAMIVDASASLFKAMDRMRADRTTTRRILTYDDKIEGDVERYVRGLRDAEMPAMGRSLEVLPGIEFAQKQALLSEFDRLHKALIAEQKEFWEEMSKPKGSRRAALGQEYMDTETGLIETLDKISAVLAAEVNHQDAAIDQLLMIKQ